EGEVEVLGLEQAQRRHAVRRLVQHEAGLGAQDQLEQLAHGRAVVDDENATLRERGAHEGTPAAARSEAESSAVAACTPSRSKSWRTTREKPLCCGSRRNTAITPVTRPARRIGTQALRPFSIGVSAEPAASPTRSARPLEAARPMRPESNGMLW